VRVIVVRSYSPYSAWVRDSYLSFATPRREIVFVRPAAARAYIDHLRGDAYTPVAVARIAGGTLYDAKIFFEGGNVQIGLRPGRPRDIFVNSHLFKANTEQEIPQAVVQKEIKKLFGPALTVLPEVDLHLDTYLTFATGGNAFVGDPRLALPCLNSYRAVHPFEAISSIQRHDCIAKLDRVATLLRKRGYRVHRIPWLPQPPMEPSHVFLTYNNGEFVDTHTFLMPVYGLPTDETAQAVFEKAGVHVIPVDVRSISWGGRRHALHHSGGSACGFRPPEFPAQRAGNHGVRGTPRGLLENSSQTTGLLLSSDQAGV
jgi:hypothetical protein